MYEIMWFLLGIVFTVSSIIFVVEVGDYRRGREQKEAKQLAMTHEELNTALEAIIRTLSIINSTLYNGKVIQASDQIGELTKHIEKIRVNLKQEGRE